MSVRVRFAPSPTGHLHVGSARTALFNWLLARHERGTFILRIEDTDTQRSKPEYLESLLDDLRWVGLIWDEGPYFQSKRLEIYKTYALQLVEQGLAYPCFCTPEMLAQKREEAERLKKPPRYDGTCRYLTQAEKKELENSGAKSVLRFRSPQAQKLAVRDLVRGLVDFSSELFEDFVIMKSDGSPLYNFACVIDDHLMNITHVLRGEEHLSNTPRQLLLYQAFGWEPPQYGHLSIILDEQRKKLSKREGATYLSEFKESGFLPEALLNFLALLGWAPKENLEILSLQEIIERFSIEGIGKSPAVFDFKKLEWMNGEYIKKLSVQQLSQRLLPYIKPFKPEEDWFEKLAALFQERIKTLKQFATDANYFFSDIFEIDPQGTAEQLKPSSLVLLEEFLAELEKSSFSIEELEVVLRSFSERKKVKASELIHPVRLLITGKRVSPGIFQVMALLGKERTLRRIQKGVASLKKAV